MSHPLRILPAVQHDIEDVLAFTLQHFGERQYETYRRRIRDAIEAIAADPDHPDAKRRPEIHRKARTFHLGRRARHFFLYRVADDGVVEIARFLYDGMDLSQHLPPDYRPDA